MSVASKDNPEFGAEPEYWLTGKALTLNEAADKWVILNAGLTGGLRKSICTYLCIKILINTTMNFRRILSSSIQRCTRKINSRAVTTGP